MEENNTITIIIVVILTTLLIVFLIWKNKKDRKLLNPDSQDAVEETKMDEKRREDKI